MSHLIWIEEVGIYICVCALNIFHLIPQQINQPLLSGLQIQSHFHYTQSLGGVLMVLLKQSLISHCHVFPPLSEPSCP